MKNLFIITVCSLFLVTSCSNNTSSPITQTEPLPTTDIKYEIVREDNRDPIITLDVYIQDTAQLDNLNLYLNKKYNPGKDKFFLVMYFNDKEVASVWHKKLDDESVSEKEWVKLQPHRIAVYHCNPKTNLDELVRDHWKK